MGHVPAWDAKRMDECDVIKQWGTNFIRAVVRTLPWSKREAKNNKSKCFCNLITVEAAKISAGIETDANMSGTATALVVALARSRNDAVRD